MHPGFSLRPLEPGDHALVYRIVEVTMRGYVEQAFGAWNEQEQHASIEKRLTLSSHRIIHLGGTDVGIYAVEYHPDHINLDWLFLLPEAQKKGIGRSLLSGLQAEARAQKLPLRLHVLICNPARLWYQREGFHITRVTKERWYMEFSA